MEKPGQLKMPGHLDQIGVKTPTIFSKSDWFIPNKRENIWGLLSILLYVKPGYLNHHIGQ